MNDFSIDMVLKYIGASGQMEKRLAGFKHRHEQTRLAEEVARAFMNDRFLTAEVGTGVGKTFAYLVPAIIWAGIEKEKVVISTRTKALQQQIIDRDLPDLKNIWEQDFRYAEARGRENYLCWNKYNHIIGGRKKLEEAEEKFIVSILSWAEKTRTGDRKELSLNSELMKNWGLVACDRKSCQKEFCRYRDKCFRLKMIKNLGKADIIIVNHALLLADTQVDNAILPEYKYLIIDEAHTFNRESFDKLSNRFSYYENMDLYRLLFSGTKAGKGYLAYLKNRFANLSPLLSEATTLVDRGMQKTREFFTSITKRISYREDFNFAHIMENRGRDYKWYEEAAPLYQDWQANHNLLIKKLEDIAQELSGDEEEFEIKGMTEALLENGDKGFSIMQEDIGRDDKVVWMEYDKGQAVALCSSFINVGDVIDQQLYQKLRALVMVSATLAIEDKFDYFADKNGLTAYAREGRFYTLLEKSPFDYENHACLYVLQDMPEPTSGKFDEEVKNVLDNIISAAGGNILVLFTSRKQLKEASEFLRPRCEKKHLELLVQYEDGEFGTLMDKFTSANNTVLMGLETFWEGIDLKGDLLRCLVIVKLPFRAPSDPYASAWDKHYRLQGKNSFAHFMLPDAAVRFKQGVGRLIRSEDDRGAVVVLDTRLTNRSYGKVFCNSIPIKNVTSVRKDEIARCLQEWL